MDAFEINKIVGAILFAFLVLFGTKTATEFIFAPHAPEKPGYEVEIAETSESAAEPAAALSEVSAISTS